MELEKRDLQQLEEVYNPNQFNILEDVWTSKNSQDK